MPVALLDLDGTLTNPKVGITRSIQYALARAGTHIVDLEALTPYIGPPLRESFELLAGLTTAEVELALSAYREYFAEIGIFENAVYEGIPECLEALLERGWRLAVATSKPTVFAERILRHFSLRESFEIVAGAELDGTREQKADVISYCLALLGVSPGADCFMIGDREHDVVAAQQTGIRSVGVTWGFGTAAELTNAGADLLVERVVELPDALARSFRDSPSLP